MDIKWICPYCGDEQTKEKPKTYCLNCHKGRYQEWHQCECGKWFHPDRLSKKYCSQECHYKYMPKGGKKGKHYPHTQRARIAICPVCGKEFRAIHEYKDRKSVYCSKECWNVRATKTNYCLICGKEITTSISVDKKYCSAKCVNEAARQRTGENSPAWQGGKTKESKCRRTRVDYKDWRLKVFQRDNFTCQQCGKKTRDIEAHHIKEACNYPELIYDVDNGITLCHKCHKETDNYGYKAKIKKAVLIND